MTRIAVAGDIMFTRSIDKIADVPRLAAIADSLLGVDAAVANLETPLHDYEHPPAHESGGTWLRGPRTTATTIQELGFSAVALANNHLGDYGAGGVHETLATLRDAGLPGAGAGLNLSDAAAPTAVAGVLSLVAATTTFPTHSLATDELNGSASRPGVNGIAVPWWSILPDRLFEPMREIVVSLGGDDGTDEVEFGRYIIRRGKAAGAGTEAHPTDVDRICAAVSNAAATGLPVVVSIHSHEGDGQEQNPSPALITIAHAAIDAGASIVSCHGPHRLRGVEFYRRRVIFYGLGSLIFQLRQVTRLPAQQFTAAGLSPDATTDDLWARRHDYLAREACRESMIGFCDVDERGDVTHCSAAAWVFDHVDHHHPDYGIPHAANADELTRIADRLTQLSQPWGTQASVSGGRINLRP